MNKKDIVQKIKQMSYVELMSFLGEINRPPGGKDSIRRLVQNCFIAKDSLVLDIGCNTGYCSFEIAHLAKCHVTGVDISSDMIKTAKILQRKDPLKHLIKFIVEDATKLSFKNQSFDVVVSGGSTAFIDDKNKAIREYRRVLKPWGFIVDINFFYKKPPPHNLITKLNKLMDTKIKPWDINYWLDIYKKHDLEKYFIFTDTIKEATIEEVKNYCIEMSKLKKLPEKAHIELLEKLTNIMILFNENHKYLAYGIFIFRKRPVKEQISLFGA